MANWPTDKPALANQISADVPDIEKCLQELHDVITAITNGTLGTTTAADFRVNALATNTVSLDATPDSDHTTDGIISSLTAGENLVFGDVCYMKSDGKLWKAQAGTGTTILPGIAMAIATITAEATGNFILYGFARDDTWAWTVGKRLVVSDTAGAFKESQVTTHYSNYVAIATHADRILFMPQLDLTTPI